MRDAAHNQHSETRRPSDRDRIVTTGPSRFAVSSPPVQKCCAEMMSVSIAGIQKNRCRTTMAVRVVETRAELPFTGDQVALFRAQPGRWCHRAPTDRCVGYKLALPPPRYTRLADFHMLVLYRHPLPDRGEHHRRA